MATADQGIKVESRKRSLVAERTARKRSCNGTERCHHHESWNAAEKAIRGFFVREPNSVSADAAVSVVGKETVRKHESWNGETHEFLKGSTREEVGRSHRILSVVGDGSLMRAETADNLAAMKTRFAVAVSVVGKETEQKHESGNGETRESSKGLTRQGGGRTPTVVGDGSLMPPRKADSLASMETRFEVTILRAQLKKLDCAKWEERMREDRVKWETEAAEGEQEPKKDREAVFTVIPSNKCLL